MRLGNLVCTGDLQSEKKLFLTNQVFPKYTP